MLEVLGQRKFIFLNLNILHSAIENVCVSKKLQYFAEACRMSKFKEGYLLGKYGV